MEIRSLKHCFISAISLLFVRANCSCIFLGPGSTVVSLPQFCFNFAFLCSNFAFFALFCLSLLFFASFCHTSKQLLHNPLKISIFARYFKGQPSGVGLYFWNDMNDENNGKFEKEIGYENRFIGYENKFINFHGYSVLRLLLNCKKCKVRSGLKNRLKY